MKVKCPHCGEDVLKETSELYKLKEKGFQIFKDGQVRIYCLACKQPFFVDQEEKEHLKEFFRKIA